MKIRISGGRVVDPVGMTETEQDILIENGVIVA